MSNASTAATPPPPKTPAEAARNVREGARFGADFVRVRWTRLLLAFAGIGLPLWAFGQMVDELREGDAFFFDEPLLEFAHASARAGFDSFFLLASEVGYTGVILADVVLVLALAVRGRRREGVFAAVAMLGSTLLNAAAKHVFRRERPSLWQSIAPEVTYSFPSGHAMGSITLAWIAVLLWWHLDGRRLRALRWPVTVLALAFTVSIGLSRVYLGVHYPSDILAGWAAASVWTVSAYGLVFHGHLRPWK
jgi:undecaprenyl-diphosphatase